MWRHVMDIQEFLAGESDGGVERLEEGKAGKSGRVHVIIDRDAQEDEKAEYRAKEMRSPTYEGEELLLSEDASFAGLMCNDGVCPPLKYSESGLVVGKDSGNDLTSCLLDNADSERSSNHLNTQAVPLKKSYNNDGFKFTRLLRSRVKKLQPSDAVAKLENLDEHLSNVDGRGYDQLLLSNRSSTSSASAGSIGKILSQPKLKAKIEFPIGRNKQRFVSLPDDEVRRSLLISCL